MTAAQLRCNHDGLYTLITSVLHIFLPSTAAPDTVSETHTGTEIVVQLRAHKRATLKEVMRPANKSTVNDTRHGRQQKALMAAAHRARPTSTMLRYTGCSSAVVRSEHEKSGARR